MRCLSSPPDGFPALLSAVQVPGPSPPTTLAGFFSTVLPAGLPAGPYLVFLAVTPLNAFADGRMDTDDVPVATGTFLYTP